MNLFKTVKNGLIAFTLATLAVAGFAAKTTITYIHTDHLGSPVLATKEDGTVKWREDYQPFGKQLTNEDTDNNIGFTGHKDDKGLGLTYMQARWYHPEVGRFMALDPILYRDVHSFNRYVYGNNNPYNYVDPDGKIPILVPLIFIGKEVVSEIIESQTGVPMPTVKNAVKLGGKFAFKQVAGEVGDALRDGSYAKISKEVTKGVNKNSRSYKGQTDVYAIRDPDGNVHKIGESAAGRRLRDGASKRAESQVRKLNRKNGPGYTSEIRKTFPDKDSARTYETNLIERYRQMYGQDKLPGNKTNR